MRGDASGDGVVAAKDKAVASKNEEDLLVKDDKQRHERVGEMDAHLHRSRLLIRLASRAEELLQGHVPERRWARAIAHNVPGGFREKEQQGKEEDAGKDRQEPEDRGPVQELGQQPTDDGSERRPKDPSGGRVSNINTAFSSGHHIGDDCIGQGNSAAAPRALQAAKDEEGRIVALEGEPDVGSDIDDKANDVRGPPTRAVR